VKNITIYTDGACSGNPGVGGWGAVLQYGDHRKEMSGADENTTNNRMEVFAVIQALSALKYPCHVDLYSDSAYTVNAFEQKWIYGWAKSGWTKADGKPVLNADLWQTLYTLTKTHRVTFHKVKGHADNEENNRCDFLATSAIKQYKADHPEKCETANETGTV
jgi:ribonuclease HI